MLNPHHPTHWIAVALVSALALIALDAAGQDTTAAATFAGRPAMAGPQAGLGALAGPPQGGIGLQGSKGAALNLRRPAVIEQSMHTAPRGDAAACNGPRITGAESMLCLPQLSNDRVERRLARLGIDPQ